MYSVKNNIENMIVIKNSKFITNIFYVESIDDIEDNLRYICDKYSDASHNTYAYIVGNNIRCSDDNEPSCTAGKPMLNVLIEKKLNNVLVVTTRYFGGIKLGVGGLVRAYTKSVTEVLDKSNIVSLVRGYNIDIIFNYDKLKEIDYILRDYDIIDKEYKDKIRYNIDIDKVILDKLDGINGINIVINSEKYIRK